MTSHDDMQADIAENEQRIAVHEAVCAERYAGIQDRLQRGDKRMQRIEYILYFLIASVLIGPSNAMKLVEAFFK
ncbi:hypothetical protein FEP95_04745 [Burkholderia multivorans]|nr:hypothetical protein [Burkholderia multivorans]